MLLELLWVEDFGQKAERLNTGKMSLNCSEVLLHCSIEIIIWCPLIVLLEGSQETTLPSICAFILCRTAMIHPEGVIYHGKQNPRRDCFLRREGAQCPVTDDGIWISVEKPTYCTGKLMWFCFSTLLWEAHSTGEKLKLGRDM